jgi:hypothetical protein
VRIIKRRGSGRMPTLLLDVERNAVAPMAASRFRQSFAHAGA